MFIRYLTSSSFWCSFSPGLHTPAKFIRLTLLNLRRHPICGTFYKFYSKNMQQMYRGTPMQNTYGGLLLLIKCFVIGYTRWVRRSERWQNKLKMWRVECYLAATCFIDSSIPVSSLLLSFRRPWNMDFNPLYFFSSFLQQNSRESHLVGKNRMISFHSSTTNSTYSFKIPFRRALFFAVVVNICLVFFHIKSGNICESFSPKTCSKMNKVTITTCNKNWFGFLQSSWLDRIMLTDISISIVETYAICYCNLLVFQSQVDGIEQGFTRRTMFIWCCAHVERTKIDGFRTIDIKY